MKTIIIATVLGMIINDYFLPKPILNFILIGMILSAVFANMLSESELSSLMHEFNPILWIARLGVTLIICPATVIKYLGFTLLPHSWVSLVFTGIAVSTEAAQIIQRTIATAAVINELIGVIFAKKGFEWAGELTYKKV